MGLRHIVIFACLCVTRCSADPKAGFVNQLAGSQRGSKDSGNPSVVQKSGDAGHQGDEAGNGPSKGEGKSGGGQAGDGSGKESDKGKLPEVYIDSDQALVPIASLTSDMEIDRGGYTFISQPLGEGVLERKDNPSATAGVGGGSGFDFGDLALTCTTYISQSGAGDSSRVIQCGIDAANSSNRSGYFAAAQISWSFKITDCPNATIVGNVELHPECFPQEAATCAYVRPALRLSMGNVDREKCFLKESKLTFTIREKFPKASEANANSPQTSTYKQVLKMAKP